MNNKSKFSVKLLLMFALTVFPVCFFSCSTSNSDGDGNSGSITLAGMEKAAHDAGYTTEDSYTGGGGKAVGGFTIAIPLEHGEVHTYIYEHKSASDAADYAKFIDSYGYQKMILNGKFSAMASASEGKIMDQLEYDILEAILFGKTIPANKFQE